MNTPEKMHNALMILAAMINAKSGGAYKARFNNQYGQVEICAPVTPFRSIGLIFVDASFLRFSILPVLQSEKAAITAVLVSAGYIQDAPNSVRFSLPV